MDVRYIDAVDGAVVVEVVAVPVAAFISMADVAEAIVDAAVEADVQAPEAAMKAVTATIEAPVSGGPKCSGVRGRAPGSGDPVVATGRPCPVAGSPEVVRLRGRWLLVDGKRWRGLVSVCVDGLVVVFVALLITLIALLVALVGLLIILVGLSGRDVVRGVRSLLLDGSGCLLIVVGLLLALVDLALTEDSCPWSRADRTLAGGWILLYRLCELVLLIGVNWRLVRGGRIGSNVARILCVIGITLASCNSGQRCQPYNGTEKVGASCEMFEVKHRSSPATTYDYLEHLPSE